MPAARHSLTPIPMTRQRVLVLYWYPTAMRPAIRHHLEALKYSPHHHALLYHNIARGIPSWMPRLRFDVAVLHTTLFCLRWAAEFPLFKWRLNWLRHHPARKIALPQDEYDHAHVLDEWLCDLGVTDIYTNFSAESRRLLYPRMAERARFHECFTGYIDPATASSLEGRLLPLAKRRLDLVYRARCLPFWFGRHGQLKVTIADVVREAARRHGLVCDLSTRREDEIESDAWFDFLASSRAVLGVESGSSVLDTRGQIMALVRWLNEKEPSLSFEEVSRRLPPGWDDYRFFALGPRHFEAVCTRTVQVLVQSEYNGVLVPDRHYLPLRRDFGNLDEVLEKLKDLPLLERIADNAYGDIYQSGRYSYATLAGLLDKAILEPLPARRLMLGIPFCWVSALRSLRKRYRSSLLARLVRTCRRLPGRAWRLLSCRVFPLGWHLAALGLQRATRSVLWKWLRSPSHWREVRPSQLIKDMLLFRAAFQEAVRSGRYVLVLDADSGRLLLTDVRQSGATPVDREEVEAALERGEVQQFAWEHSAVGEAVWCRCWGVGRHYYLGGDGLYEFSSFAPLLRRQPRRFVALLRQMLRRCPVMCERRQTQPRQCA
jgi:hypothetical protein